MKILVGTYSQELAGMEGNGKGIYRLSFDSETGAFANKKLLHQCVNPSSLALAREEGRLFAAREAFSDNKPTLMSLQIEEQGAISPISCLLLSGELPCKIAYDPIHKRLASAQYWTGDVAIASLEEGVFYSQAVYTTQIGSGPNAARQKGPHAHYVEFTDNGEVLHIVDLGTDSIISHRLAPDNTIIQTNRLKLTPGSGPRHMAISKDENRAFVLCELDESLISLKRKGLGWQSITQQPGFPLEDGQEGSGAAIRLSPDERHLYVSSRRLSSIACFLASNKPKPLGQIETGGISPRDFLITSDGNWLIAANQNSNTLTSLRRNTETGLLTPSGHSCEIGSPVALIEESD